MNSHRFQVLRALFKCTGIAVLFIAPGCHYKNYAYPQTFPPLPKPADVKHGCPEIGGHYKNKGQVSTGKFETILEAEFLWGSRVCEGEQAESIEILHASSSTVALRGYRSGAVCGERTLTYEKDYRCDEEGLVVSESHSHTEAAAVAAEKRTRALTFMKASDGSLILKDSLSATGASAYMIVPLPYGYGECWWYRFETVTQ